MPQPPGQEGTARRGGSLGGQRPGELESGVLPMQLQLGALSPRFVPYRLHAALNH